MSELADGARRYATHALSELAEPQKATGMQACMKTDMLSFGVLTPHRVPIVIHPVSMRVPADRVGYEGLVMGLWDLLSGLSCREATKHIGDLVGS